MGVPLGQAIVRDVDVCYYGFGHLHSARRQRLLLWTPAEAGNAATGPWIPVRFVKPPVGSNTPYDPRRGRHIKAQLVFVFGKVDIDTKQ